MLKKALVAIGVLCCLALALPGLSQAGFVDDLKQAGRQIKSDINKATDYVAGGKKPNTEGLPAGVHSRLKKINKELDLANKALAKGVGSKADRAARAERHMTTAKRNQAEIEKRYAGKYKNDHPYMVKTMKRMAAMEAAIQEGLAGEPAGQAASQPAANPASGPAVAAASAKPAPSGKLPSSVMRGLRMAKEELQKAKRVTSKGESGSMVDWAIKQAAMHTNAAKKHLANIQEKYADQAPPSHPEIAAVSKQIEDMESRVATLAKKTASAKEAVVGAKAADEAASKQWEDKLAPFDRSDSDQKFGVVFNDDAAKWNLNKARFDKFLVVWQQYRAAKFPGGKSGALQGLEQRLARAKDYFETMHGKWAKKNQEASANLGGIVFSKSPINPNAPANLTTSFKTGDYIYGLIQTKQSFKQIFSGRDKTRVMIDAKIDGKKMHAQFIILSKPADQNGTKLPFEIAPAPGQMKAYGNPDITYGRSTDTMHQGPMELTHKLSELSPGKHTFSFNIKYYSKVWAQGSFTIEGSDYSFYAGLHKKAKQAVGGATVLPSARMKNPGIEDTMKKLLTGAGWKVYRLNIVDKDWWTDRVSGGNSAVKSRHMDAAVMAKDGQGYYYKKVRFHQPMTISGWGKLYISRTGGRIDVPESNKDK